VVEAAVVVRVAVVAVRHHSRVDCCLPHNSTTALAVQVSEHPLHLEVSLGAR